MQRVIDNRSQSVSFMIVPYLMFISIMGGVSFAAITISTAAAGKIFPASAESFSEFADVFPGAPGYAAESRGFMCPDKSYSFYYDTSETHCVLQPETGVFSSVDVTIAGGAVRQITFLVRDNRLTIGDLALFLGRRDFRTIPHTAFFSFRGKLGIASVVGGGPFSLFRRIWQVTFTDAQFPV